MTEQEYIHIDTLTRLRLANDVLNSTLYTEDDFNEKIECLRREVYSLIRHLEKTMPDITHEDSE